MQVRNRLNGGLVSVSDEYAKRLIASGEYEAIEKPRKAAPKRAAKAKDEEKKED